ncbi:MAG TPA: hypothetical protein PKK67_06900, partial [Cyclobacteriaceae bacterium]|nr:hypothetical protein [Cyclobacteriaceae bacterium]
HAPCLTPQNQIQKQKNVIYMNEALKDVLMPLTIIGSFGAAIYFFTKVMTDYVLKKRMIEKGFVNDDTQAIFKQHTSDNRFSSLKWGLIIFFAGLSLVILEYIPTGPESPLPYGLFALSVSLGFLVYYYIIKRELNK